MSTPTARRPRRLPALVWVALVAAGIALGVLVEARTGPLAPLPVAGIFLLGSLVILAAAAAVARRSGWERDDDHAWAVTWRDVISRPWAEAPVLVWVGVALGVLVFDAPPVVGTVAVLVVIALLLPGAAFRVLRR